MLEGFKKFIMRGNMIDMAIGVVMGGVVTQVVNAIVNGLINPLVTAIFGKQDMNNLWTFTLNGSKFLIGMILGALINFLIMAVAVYFCIVLPINKMRDVSQKAAAKMRKGDDSDIADAEPDLSPEEQSVMLLQDIRNAMVNQGMITGEHVAKTADGTAKPAVK
ncbi:MAG: large conductance mechanosensitive channel protein MscL [Bifidobacterium sp.]|nr:large conductance mechanosensitive channel protein MscL [Bifidobacterium sp.]